MAILNNVIDFKENIDTIRCSAPSECLVDDSTLFSLGWRETYNKGVFQDCIFINLHGINLQYYPKIRYLCATMSAPKIMTGSNTGLFDFTQTDLFFLIINTIIANVLNNCFVYPPLNEWKFTRYDVNVDIPFIDPNNKKIYLEYFSKYDVSSFQFKKTNYKTGTQLGNKSLAELFYGKEEQIEDLNPNKVTDADRLFLNDDSKTHLRTEFQLKSTTVHNRFKKNRTMENLLTREVASETYDDYVKKFKLDLKILTKTELFEFIDSDGDFGKVKSERMKKYFQDLNELTSDEFNILYSNGKYKHYKNELQAKNVSIYYFSQKPTEIVDFKNKTVTIDPKVLFNYVVQNVVERILESVLKYDIVKVQHFDTFKELLKMVLLHSYPDRGS